MARKKNSKSKFQADSIDQLDLKSIRFLQENCKQINFLEKFVRNEYEENEKSKRPEIENMKTSNVEY